MTSHTWSWATWGCLRELTQLTELDVSDAHLPGAIEQDDVEHVIVVRQTTGASRVRADEGSHSWLPCLTMCVCVVELPHLRLLCSLSFSASLSPGDMPLPAQWSLFLLSRLSPTLVHLKLADLPQLDDTTLAHIVTSTPALESIKLRGCEALTTQACVTTCTHLHSLKDVQWPRDRMPWTVEQVKEAHAT